MLVYESICQSTYLPMLGYVISVLAYMTSVLAYMFSMLASLHDRGIPLGCASVNRNSWGGDPESLGEDHNVMVLIDLVVWKMHFGT